MKEDLIQNLFDTNFKRKSSNLSHSMHQSRCWLNESTSSSAFILFHGAYESPHYINDLGDHLHKNLQINVFCCLAPYHWVKDSKGMDNANYLEWIKYIENIVSFVATYHRNIFVGGHSLGGLMSYYAATRFPQIKGVLLLAPALHFKKSIKSFLALGAKAGLTMNLGRKIDGKYIQKYSLRAGAEILKFQKKINNDNKKLECPFFLVYSLKDEIICSRYLNNFFSNFDHHKEQIIYDIIGHNHISRSPDDAARNSRDIFNPHYDDMVDKISSFFEHCLNSL